LSSQLTRARHLLAQRLARYGLAVSGGALAAALCAKTAAACVTSALTTSTSKAAVLVASGPGLTAGAVPARVLALTEGVVKAMFLNTLKRGSAVVVLLGALGAGLLALPRLGAQPTPNQAATSPKDEPRQEATRAAADDLEALRLEVEALRKSLQATRERVKTLEDQVQTLQGKGSGTGSQGKGSGTGSQEAKPKGATYYETVPFSNHATTIEKVQRPTPKREGADDPLAEAEAALKKLKENPDNKEAADALEKALQRLKERKKPEGATGNPQAK
jgi:flagellar motility protein MotE (MotC chaperone)